MSEEIEKLKAEAEKYRSMKVKSAAAEKLYDASTRLKDKGEDAEAIRLLLQAIKLYEDEREEKAVEFLEKAAPLLDALSQPKLAGETYLNAAKHYVRRADHRRAIALYAKAADSYRRANLMGDAADSIRTVAEQYEALSEPLIAAEQLEKEAGTRLQINDASGAARALREARDLYGGSARYDESARCLKKAAEVLIQAGNRRDGERIYLQVAEDLQKASDQAAENGDHGKSAHFLLEAASIYVKAKQPAEAARCHIMVAEEYLKSGNTNEASENFRKATIENLLSGELVQARSIVDSIKNDDVRKTGAFKQALTLIEIFEKGDEEKLNALLREISDFSWVRLSLAFGKFIK